ncbi:MAG: hypothetical protein F6K00_13840 [Leptolyngbya sp. SIOISBB]|nr:hypothetical protein [Leptolyngbya sp. SIOISBB]
MGHNWLIPWAIAYRCIGGTEDEILQTGQRLRMMFGMLSIPLATASFFIARSARQLRQEFIVRSHQ